ncbi:polyphenol oxidase, chloroplastic [Dendrobium catenatum]|uniref:Polyphenol oxidase, chloroplastic n=1 Tax=Dendrobium catenatum TaxID=906689 RepID=A0A2I0VPI4_9ASPA|nr:polyphenol oxidase, chloroplastic [Dendrobium catenatum]PKU65310.1 Polyphenol oxidase, chloroplastic [Dendrobium catenatum]
MTTLLSITSSKPIISSSRTFQNQTFLLHSRKTIVRHPKKLSFRALASKNDIADAANGSSSRRNILIGLGGLYGTATGLAIGAPVQPPDLTQCGPADFPSGATPVNCCPPVNSIVDFTPPPASSPLRVRPAAHLVDAEYVAKYNKAVELMRNLPADDPRNFMQQANVHCAYCDGAYDQVGFPGVELQVHNCWLFFPYHRWYLYFHERILGKLIGDDTFALPFWNWDSPDGMQLPSIYTPTSSSLYDALRDPAHQPPTIIDLDFSLDTSPDSGQQLIDDNLKIMYRQVVSNGPTSELFLGAALRAGDQPDPGAGSLENVPHGTVHLWTGDSRQPNREDMGVFYSAARDPIFFAHHSNIDRLWDVWKSLGGQRQDFTDTDWLDAGFLFYDENAQLVRVKVRDCLNTELLRYKYQNVDNPWVNAKSAPAGTGRPVRPAVEPTFPVTLDKSNVTVTVSRPPTSGRTGNEYEVLEVQGIQFDSTVYNKFDVYVNASSAAVLRPAVSECAGSFAQVPHLNHQGKKNTMKTTLKLCITELLQDIGATGDDSVVVTLVPRTGAVTIAGVSISLVS